MDAHFKRTNHRVCCNKLLFFFLRSGGGARVKNHILPHKGIPNVFYKGAVHVNKKMSTKYKLGKTKYN